MRAHPVVSAFLGLAVVITACGPQRPTVETPAPTAQPTTSAQPTTAPLPTRPPTPQHRENTTEILKRLGGQLCPDSDFTCVTLNVPLDHFDTAPSKTTRVVFAVLPATGERRGMFVTATGGPGSAGLASADSYTAAFDPSLPEHFDIVFFDQRGVGASGGLQCVEAAAAFYQSDLKSDTPAHEAETIATARAFAEDCVGQMGQPESLRYLGTRQAVEDLEAFRQAIGDEKFWLYGESYGTQFAQTYAAAHPDHLAGLILDGTVDLTLSGPDYLKEQAQAFNDVLASVLKDCNAKQECAADAGGDALAVYDKLAARLARAPMTFTFPLPSGGKAVRTFALPDLENAAANNVYAEGGRMLLQRALAAAARDDLVPLARLAYDALSLDPETLAAIPDPTWSDAVYYAVECNDYEYFSGTAEDRAQAYLRAGDVVDASIPRLSSIFYGDLPCAFWPADADPRPAPLTADGIPTLVLGATADPATPVANGERVFHRLADGFLITTDGGAHVIFGRGDACPDEIVTAFLVEGKLPAQRETRCHGVIADDYVSLAPADARAFADPLDALASAETEITYLPEYYNWDGETTTSVGCPHGGALTFEAAGEDQFTLTSCAFSSGFVMTGRGTYNSDDDRFTLDVAVTGLADGKLNYAREGDGAMTVTGEYGGKEVSFTK